MLFEHSIDLEENGSKLQDLLDKKSHALFSKRGTGTI